MTKQLDLLDGASAAMRELVRTQRLERQSNDRDFYRYVARTRRLSEELASFQRILFHQATNYLDDDRDVPGTDAAERKHRAAQLKLAHRRLSNVAVALENVTRTCEDYLTGLGYLGIDDEAEAGT